MMRRRLLLSASVLSLFVSGCGGTAGGGPWLLVTPEEAARASAAPPMPAPFTEPGTTRALKPGPAIMVDQPDATRPLHPPLSFRVRFVPEAGATIDPRSFRVTYGFFALDITARLLQHARFSGQDLVAENVDIPAGNHTVTIAIGDSLGHETTRTFQFTVA